MRRLIVVLIALIAAATSEEDYDTEPVYQGYQGPPAPLSADGRVIDTPEVANAKAAHLHAHAEAMARVIRQHRPAGYLPYPLVYEDEEPYDGSAYVLPNGYHGPLAPLANDGRVLDTPEVAHAKAAHLAAHAREAAKASNHVYNIYDDRTGQLYAAPLQLAYTHLVPVGYRGPPAPLGHDGRVIDTPEVAHAKAAHLQAHAYATLLTAPSLPEPQVQPQPQQHHPQTYEPENDY